MNLVSLDNLLAQLCFPILIAFLWFFSWAPQSHKVTCRARPVLLQQISTPPPPLWWWFMTISVGPLCQNLFLPSPLLPGYQVWPLGWPRNHWDPPSLSLEICPSSEFLENYKCLFCCLIAYCVIHFCLFQLNLVLLAYSDQI